MENKLFEEKMSVINLGLPGFFESVKDQGAPCVHVDWRPPAGGDVRLIEILDRLRELG
ncbi:MAG TPA: fdrA domain protein [Candidatus Flavonifractor merdigallinarum]|uniref:FdrA domain protein n=1 Tax=Candidatus Flavonifractor merdigallinarum TaxID=2838589 RepID=A0A9D2C045_9FIRM|nr:fdrA domain protein [Candidatus Flavonifractor merdigallinarum]